MKDEVKGKIISKFVEVNSKIYSLVVVGSDEIKKTKGFNKDIVKTIRHKVTATGIEPTTT